MSSKTLNIAIILTAYDKATRVLNNAINQQQEKLKELKRASQNAFGQGAAFTGAGMAVLAAMKPTVDAFRELEDAQLSLKSAMMGPGGNVGAEFEKIDKLAQKLGTDLPGTTADFYNMFETMLNQGVPAQTILDGVGQSAAYLAVALKMPYDEAGRLASKLKEATGTANQDMMQFMDTIARTRNMGVDSGEMQYAFGRSAGALKLMNIQGLEASKNMAALYAMIIRTGLSGETTGTGFASILNNIVNPDKMAKANAEAKALGVSLEFMDKAGQFKGVENMVAQLDKLRDFTAEQRAAVVNALTGGGQDAQMLQTMITKGVQGFNQMQRSMAGQATLQQKVGSQLGSLSNVWEATTGTIRNSMAAIGKSMAPELKKIAELIGKAGAAFGAWMEANPQLGKFIALTATGVGVLLTVVGVIKLIRGAMIMLNVVMMANPFVLIAMAAIAAATLIYTYWDDIVAFFRNLWAKVKQIFWQVVAWVKQWLDKMIEPLVWLMEQWGKLVKWFDDLWVKIKAKFWDFVEFIVHIPEKMYEAGKNIVASIKKGIEDKAQELLDSVKNLAKNIRDYFPFSPAKTGPLRDIHKLKLVETIAATIKPGPMQNALDNMIGGTFGQSAPAYAPAGGGGGVSINYAPNITFGGSVSVNDKQQFSDMLRKHQRELMRMVDEAIAKKERTKY